MSTILAELLVSRGEAARAFLQGAQRRPLDRAAFAVDFAAASRKVGRAPLALTSAEAARLETAGVPRGLEVFSVDELARTLMLNHAAESLDAVEHTALVESCYEQGDNRERQAVLRSLTFLPDPARYLRTAVEACRTNVVPVFEAIACDNAYPEAHFPELHFNQLVLKAVFVGLPLGRVIGLERRRTPELARMARDYAAERRAAGRSVSTDLELLLAPHGAQGKNP